MRMTWSLGTAALLVAACGGSKPKNANEGSMGADMGAGSMNMTMVEPTPDTRAVLDAVKDYTSWSKFTEIQQPKRSEGHMNMYVLGFHNQVVGDAIKSSTVPLPDGAIIVKQEMMKADAPAMSITVMSKRGGAWYWVKASPDGMKVIGMKGMALEGRDVAMCKDCHDNASDNDFVLTHKFK
jgi:hypothetical protein